MKLLLGIIIGALLAGGVFYYYVFTTTTSSAEAMSMIEPKNGDEKASLTVKPSGAVTFILTANDEIYYYAGAFNDSIYKTDYFKVREIIINYKSRIHPDDLMFIIKSDKAASFKNAIDILDEMAINKVPPGHYAETEITEAEIYSINILKKTKNG